MPVHRGPRETLAHEYTYRRVLTTREMVPAVGVAIGAGIFAFYVAQVLLQRTPLVPRPAAARESDRSVSSAPRVR